MINRGQEALTSKFSLCLNGEWEFRQKGHDTWLPAQVPGCNFSDLLANKQIDDPFYRDEEHQLQWIEQKDWHYRTSFNIETNTLLNDEIEIVFDGLDTYCDVYLNNILIHKNKNMFIGYRIACKKWLSVGSNELRVEFRSPTNEVMPTFEANAGIALLSFC